MATGQQIVTLDMSELIGFVAQLRAGGRAAIDEAWKALLAWGSEYHRRVQRVTPVETGRARQSWVLVSEKTSSVMSVTIGNTIKGGPSGAGYPVYLEFGTARIAGGRVKDWQPGQAPVMTWAAKLDELPVMPSLGTRKHERYVNVMEKAFTLGSGEQMPMLRPIGYEIAPKVVEDVLQAVREGFESVKNKRRGGTP